MPIWIKLAVFSPFLALAIALATASLLNARRTRRDRVPERGESPGLDH